MQSPTHSNLGPKVPSAGAQKPSHQDLMAQAKKVLKSNDHGIYTAPSPSLYPHQWAWDSALAALGWAHMGTKENPQAGLDRALLELETLMSGAWPNGMVPHIQFRAQTDQYYPGPEEWDCPHPSSTITQPPLWVEVCERLLDLGADQQRILGLLPAFERSLAFFHAERDPGKLGCIAVVHPWESGRDNCPAWDDAMATITPLPGIGEKRKDLRHVDDPKERPSDLTYGRYMHLVQNLAHTGFMRSGFAVYDPMMTALVLRGEESLAHLCERLAVSPPPQSPDAIMHPLAGMAGRARVRAERLRQGLMKHLWDAQLGRFIFLWSKDAAEEGPWQRTEADVLAAYMPLTAGVPMDESAVLPEKFAQNYQSTFGLCSTARSQQGFEPACYWRGPIWMNLCWLMREQVAVREQCLRLVQEAGCSEYFHPETGAALGTHTFTWTAALTLDWLLA